MVVLPRIIPIPLVHGAEARYPPGHMLGVMARENSAPFGHEIHHIVGDPGGIPSEDRSKLMRQISFSSLQRLLHRVSEDGGQGIGRIEIALEYLFEGVRV